MCGSRSRTPAQADRPGDDTSFCGGAPAALLALASFLRVAAPGRGGANLFRAHSHSLHDPPRPPRRLALTRPAWRQVLDRYFGNVCELDLIFNFHKAYHILDELLIAGELQEPSKKAILRVTAAQDALMEGSGDSKVSDSKYEI